MSQPDNEQASQYRIGTVARNWTIEERLVHSDRSKTPGRVEWRPAYYFGSQLHLCAKKLMDLRTRENYEQTGVGVGRVIECLQRAQQSVQRSVEALPSHLPDDYEVN